MVQVFKNQQFQRRISNHSFPILVNTPESHHKSHDSNVAVVLFGFAGSHMKQLGKHSSMYNSLGYTTVSCILPMHYTFTYDIANIRRCGREVLDRLAQENITKIVPVCFSNNGAILYQHILDQLRPGDADIVGTVFDSAPGPMLGHVFWFLPESLTNPPAAPDKLSLILGQVWINAANRVPVKESLSKGLEQVRGFQHNPSVPWPSHYFKHQDTSMWPKLFIYSEGDQMIRWQFLDSVVKNNIARGRRTEQWRVQKAGHVAIQKMYPDQYRQRVETFLHSLM